MNKIDKAWMSEMPAVQCSTMRDAFEKGYNRGYANGFEAACTPESIQTVVDRLMHGSSNPGGPNDPATWDKSKVKRKKDRNVVFLEHIEAMADSCDTPSKKKVECINGMIEAWRRGDPHP